MQYPVNEPAELDTALATMTRIAGAYMQMADGATLCHECATLDAEHHAYQTPVFLSCDWRPLHVAQATELMTCCDCRAAITPPPAEPIEMTGRIAPDGLLRFVYQDQDLCVYPDSDLSAVWTDAGEASRDTGMTALFPDLLNAEDFLLMP